MNLMPQRKSPGRWLLSVLAVINLLTGVAWAAPPSLAVEPDALAKIEQFLAICTRHSDASLAAQEVVAAKLVHASKLDPNNPQQLNADALRFSFKKAFANAKFYEPKVIRVTATTTTGVGHGATAQLGRLHKYFVAKKPGVNGMPAPIQVFFPEQGGPPVLYDWGSL